MTAEIHDRLNGKLSRIRDGSYRPADFIIADAKDADMGGGIGALGKITDGDGTQRPATAADYLAAMARMIADGTFKRRGVFAPEQIANDKGLLDRMLKELKRRFVS